MSPPLIAALLQSCDHISDLIDRVGGGNTDPDADLEAKGKELCGRMAAIADGGAPKQQRQLVPAPKAAKADDEDTVENDNWHISLRLSREVLKNGMDPRSFLSYLRRLGELVHVVTLTDAMPAAAEMDPECLYLGFEVELKTDADKTTIEAVFEFLEADCSVVILPPRAALRRYIDLIEALPEEPMQIGEILRRCGALTDKELKRGLGRQKSEAPRQRPVGEILLEDGSVPAPALDAALNKQREVKERKSQESKSLRVDAAKLDQLINSVGELVIAAANTTVLARRSGDGPLVEAAEGMSRLVGEIREGALRMRMVQIGETFNRFRRVVRDVSQELKKDIELVTTGGETELDKAVVEKLADPLLHLVRNSMDYGIERADVRKSNGKPAQGTLRLEAYYDSGSVVIEVGDDGGGLSRQRILKRAIERGIVQPDEKLRDEDVLNLIFRPGFSTAEAVTDLSGRGVGMDVVKRNIESLRGTVHLDSKEGEGTMVRIRLPLTLAIIDGFVVGVGGTAYVVPLDTVVECLELGEQDRKNQQRSYLNLRGEVLPFITLRDLFSHEGKNDTKRENVVVIQSAGMKAGLVVDELMGEFQTVIKPLGRIFRHLRGISGATVLGSGEVALILDIQSLLQQTTAGESRRLTGRAAAALPA